MKGFWNVMWQSLTLQKSPVPCTAHWGTEHLTPQTTWAVWIPLISSAGRAGLYLISVIEWTVLTQEVSWELLHFLFSTPRMNIIETLPLQIHSQLVLFSIMGEVGAWKIKGKVPFSLHWIKNPSHPTFRLLYHKQKFYCPLFAQSSSLLVY